MKELITEEQANLLILLLSIAVTAGSLVFAWVRGPKVQAPRRKLFWIQAVISAAVGPAIWCFWRVYNSIEDFYGLDSLKALGINFLIAVGIGVLFFALFFWAPRWAETPKPARRRK